MGPRSQPAQTHIIHDLLSSLAGIIDHWGNIGIHQHPSTSINIHQYPSTSINIHHPFAPLTGLICGKYWFVFGCSPAKVRRVRPSLYRYMIVSFAFWGPYQDRRDSATRMSRVCSAGRKACNGATQVFKHSMSRVWTCRIQMHLAISSAMSCFQRDRECHTDPDASRRENIHSTPTGAVNPVLCLSLWSEGWTQTPGKWLPYCVDSHSRCWSLVISVGSFDLWFLRWVSTCVTTYI